MKILMVVTWYTDYHAEKLLEGVFHYEQSMALKKYAEASLFYPFDNSISGSFSKEEEWGLLTYRSRTGDSKAGKILRLKNFIKVVRDFKPDIIHAHVGQMAGRWAVMAGKMLNIPVVITEHKPIEAMEFDRAECLSNAKYAYGGSRANVCVSVDSMNRLKEYFPDVDFQVIYNGIINPDCEKNINAETYEEENHGENNSKDNCGGKNGIEKYRVEGAVNCSIVAAFYSKEIKGYQFLLPAIKELKDGGMNIYLHIAGGGEYLEYYKSMAAGLGIKDNCIFYGQCDRKKVYSIVRQMDFSVSASIYECSGVSVQEAMLLGKPLVVTKSGGANSLVTEDTAIVVDRESAGALADGIKEMISRKDSFNEEKIKAYAYENFEMDNVTRKYLELYSGILRPERTGL